MCSDQPSLPCCKEKTYLVFESSLLSLFSSCTKCGLSTTSASMSTKGSLWRVQVHCSHCDTRYTWNSQPYVNNIPAGNLLISSSILFSGSLPTRIIRFLHFLNCPTINHYRHILCSSKALLNSSS